MTFYSAYLGIEARRDTPNDEGNCGRLLMGTGDWDDEPCDRMARPLCEVDGNLVVVTP
ncbi:MAG: hypothetical protein H0V17_35260 [Deltaproteobacteria bacterium]|nr:hypothetical protein [Deltaproteobacteria bacterium]